MAVSRDPNRAAYESAGRHRLVWRWHFYAGLFVSPTLLIVALTGLIYIFKSEIQDLAEARLRFITPRTTRLGASAVVEAARSAIPSQKPDHIELFADPTRAAIVQFGKEPGNGLLAFVDPYSGKVLGTVASAEQGGLATFFDVVLTLHRTLFLGTTGRLVVELMLGWTIVLLVSGLYLWWPRKLRQGPGVWWLRWRANPYVVLRDLHAVSGFYLLAPCLVILVTGLFYSIVWGEAFHLVTRDRARDGQEEPQKAFVAFHSSAKPPLSLDQIEEEVRRLYAGRDLSISLGREPHRAVEVRASNDFNNTYGPYVSAGLALDPFDGEVLERKTLAENERYWWHGWTYPLHVGSVVGLPSKIVWALACLVLCAMPVTGIWMWLKRRPRGRTGFPHPPDASVPTGWLVAMSVLAITLPTVGLSMAMIVAGEFLVQSARGVRGRS